MCSGWARSSSAAFYYYFFVICVVDFGWWLTALLQGAMCKASVPEHVLRMGSVFICSIVNLMASFWTIVAIIFAAYLLFTLWSLSEVLYTADHPENQRVQDLFEEPDKFERGYGGYGA